MNALPARHGNTTIQRDHEPRAERTRELLHEAENHLSRARTRLTAAPSDYTAALADVLAVFRTSLRAYLAWNGSAAVHEDADLGTLAGRAIHLASILKTPTHRALLLAERAPAIEQAIRRSDRLGVADREDVETGWYTARNLYYTVCGELPWLFQASSLSHTATASPTREPARPERALARSAARGEASVPQRVGVPA